MYREMTDKERLLEELKQMERDKQRWERRAIAAELALEAIGNILDGDWRTW